MKKKDSKEMYAMKYMNKIQIIQKKAVDNVYREITILKALEHAFLVNLWFAFQDEEDIFVVIDLMLGKEGRERKKGEEGMRKGEGERRKGQSKVR